MPLPRYHLLLCCVCRQNGYAYTDVAGSVQEGNGIYTRLTAFIRHRLHYMYRTLWPAFLEGISLCWVQTANRWLSECSTPLISDVAAPAAPPHSCNLRVFPRGGSERGEDWNVGMLPYGLTSAKPPISLPFIQHLG